jgi:hypothetical protein
MTRPRRRSRPLLALVALALLGACTSELDTLGEPLRIVGATLPNAVLREPYEQPIHVVGGLRPYDVQLETGELPPGLKLESGVIRGSPEEVGDYAFTLKASDANLSQVVQEYSLRVTAAPPVTLRFEAPQTEVRAPVTLRATVRDARALTGLRTLVRWDATAFRLREGSVTATRGGLALVSQPGEGALQVDLAPLGDTLDGRRELFRFVLEPVDPPAFLHLTYETEFLSETTDPDRRHAFERGSEGRQGAPADAERDGAPDAGGAEDGTDDTPDEEPEEEDPEGALPETRGAADSTMGPS